MKNFCVTEQDTLNISSSGWKDASVISRIHWYDGGQGYSDIDAPTLAVCYRNGKCQLMRDELDEGDLQEWTAVGFIAGILTSIDFNLQLLPRPCPHRYGIGTHLCGVEP